MSAATRDGNAQAAPAALPPTHTVTEGNLVVVNPPPSISLLRKENQSRQLTPPHLKSCVREGHMCVRRSIFSAVGITGFNASRLFQKGTVNCEAESFLN